jgi:signal transduction histidine kinase
VVIAVSDTGCGIPAESLSRIFEPFFTTKEAGKGVGLGLAVVYGIVTRHHGRIDVSSTVGSGSVFTVHLPCQQEEATP